MTNTKQDSGILENLALRAALDYRASIATDKELERSLRMALALADETIDKQVSTMRTEYDRDPEGATANFERIQAALANQFVEAASVVIIADLMATRFRNSLILAGITPGVAPTFPINGTDPGGQFGKYLRQQVGVGRVSLVAPGSALAQLLQDVEVSSKLLSSDDEPQPPTLANQGTP